MKRRITLLAGFTIAMSVSGLTEGADGQDAKPFPQANVRFEQNATDGDVEVVFEITGRNEGMTKLTVVSPDGRTVVDFKASDQSSMGIREFLFESPEPKDVEGLKAAYPAGAYTFAGATAAGTALQGNATLSHRLPATTSFVAPKSDAEGVAVSGLKIIWAPVKGMAGYVVELEQEDAAVSIIAKLPGSAESFSVPDGFLRPGKEYQLGIGTVSDGGNISFVETSFTTAER